MNLTLHVAPADGPLPAGATVLVEVRDTSRADAAAVSLASATTQVGPVNTDSVVVPIELASPCVGCTIWVHVDVNGDGVVSVGDLITMESFPISADQQEIVVSVRMVGGQS